MNRLVLVDGNAILHRAFHAIPPLTDKEGHPTNAIYGFTTMLLRIISDLNPTHLAVAFDRPKPTFRKELYKSYQAKRPKMDEGLASQIPTTHELLEAMHIPVYEMDGYEADDVLGTLVKKVIRDKKKVISKIEQIIIVTGDRDMLQLVEDDRVFLYMPMKGLSESKLYGEKETEERMGVTPKEIPDFKALAGDPSDNYPGVAGIGPKTASELLKIFHNVETLYKAVDHKDKILEQFSHGVIEKLEKDKENAFLSKTLATINMDVPLDVEVNRMAVPLIPTEESLVILEQLGFYSLIKRLTKTDPTSSHFAEGFAGLRGAQEKEKKSEQLTLME